LYQVDKNKSTSARIATYGLDGAVRDKRNIGMPSLVAKFVISRPSLNKEGTLVDGRWSWTWL